jgi:hypothetical protein
VVLHGVWPIWCKEVLGWQFVALPTFLIVADSCDAHIWILKDVARLEMVRGSLFMSLVWWLVVDCGGYSCLAGLVRC